MNSQKKYGNGSIRVDPQDRSQEGFKKLFTHVDQLSVKQSVDKMGLDKHIEHWAPEWLH